MLYLFESYHYVAHVVIVWILPPCCRWCTCLNLTTMLQMLYLFESYQHVADVVIVWILPPCCRCCNCLNLTSMLQMLYLFESYQHVADVVIVWILPACCRCCTCLSPTTMLQMLYLFESYHHVADVVLVWISWEVYNVCVCFKDIPCVVQLGNKCLNLQSSVPIIIKTPVICNNDFYSLICVKPFLVQWVGLGFLINNEFTIDQYGFGKCYS